ncbi:hypothetical protein LIER_30902 [Lithospermum erythrorhizon]|uniref:DCD domain-containing protein n=1 Tax=Lithospermum erythrorhizon TaxID=34254 RepID=A0AAV3RRJ5_LITER
MGRVPECGAIFMANMETKKECLELEVFALPSSHSNFVKQVKAGMLLFLFEYESRQLFGVYQAITDGGVNILAQRSCSLFKQYPAQVCFTPFWLCDPLHEKEFQDAIRENYFSKRKFNFGLSKDQVHKLLQLFSSRKLKNELRPKQLRDDGESFHDLRHKLNKKFDAENLEGRNSSPDFLIKDQGYFADRCKKEDNAYQYILNVTDNSHNTNGLPENICGSLSNKRREDNDRNLVNSKDHQSVHHDVPGLNLGCGGCGDTLDSNKGTKKDDDRYFMKLKDQGPVHHDVPGLNFSGKNSGDTLHNNEKREEEDDKYLMNLKDQRPVHHDDPKKFCGEYRDGTLDSNKRRKEEDDRHLMNLKDQQSVHHNFPSLNFSGESCGDTLCKNKRTKEKDDRYLMNLKDQRSVDLPALNIGSEYCGDTLDKVRRSSNCDELLVSGKVQYEDNNSTLAVGKYFPLPSYPSVAGNDMYRFVNRVVGDSDHDGRPSSNSPHTLRETFGFGAKGLSDDKFSMNLGSKRTYKLINSHQDALLGEINGDTKCSKPDFHYQLNGTKCSTQDMQNMDLHRPAICRNSASVFERQYRPCRSSRFESEPYLGASLESGYSFGKSSETKAGCQGATGDGLYPVKDGMLKADRSGEPAWLTKSHGNSGRSYIPSQRSFGDTFGKHNKVEGELPMDSFPNSISSFGYGASCQPNEDPLIYSVGFPLKNENHSSEAQHLVHTYPNYHESVVTKSVPCEPDLSFSHLVPSSSPRVCSSSCLLRGIAPYHDSGGPHVSNNRSLPEENHSSKFPYIDIKNKDKLQYFSTSANQDFYLGDRSLNTEAAKKGETKNGIPTYSRSPLFTTSPSANRRLPEDVVCGEEYVQNFASSPHKNLSINYFDSLHLSSSRVCEQTHRNWSTAGYASGNDLTNYDSGHFTSQGHVMNRSNDNAEHPLDVSGIHRRSVFSRLSSGPEISSHAMFNADRLFSADTTVDEVMGLLPQGKKYLEKKPSQSRKLAGQLDEEVSKTKKNLSPERLDDYGHLMMGSSERDHSKISSAKLSNDVNQADGETTDCTLRETRFVDFKRRSEMKRKLDGGIVNRSDKAVDKRTSTVDGSMGNKTVDNRTAGEGTMLSTSKCRKLVRPVFVENESTAEGMEDKPKMHVPAQSPVKDAP